MSRLQSQLSVHRAHILAGEETVTEQNVYFELKAKQMVLWQTIPG